MPGRNVPTMACMPHTRHHRALARIAVILPAILALTTILTTPTSAATSPIYQGTGWKAWTDHGIHSLNPDPYQIVFATPTARTKLKTYFARPAAQATAVTRIKINVTDTIDTTPTGVCPPRHRIIVHWEYRPHDGRKGYSRAEPCYQIPDHSAWGGHIRIDNESFSVPTWFSTNKTVNEAYKKNTVAHELGHILGLAHADTDLDKDGTVEPVECVKNKAGWFPLMCSQHGGYRNGTSSGQFVAEYDVPGLKQLTANWHLRQQ